MKLSAMRLRQRDGVTCGPSVAIVAGALLDPRYGAQLAPDGVAVAGDVQKWFSGEQGRVHREVNLIWPRALGTTPSGMARALTVHSEPRGVRYRWRNFRGRRDGLSDVRDAVGGGWPVAMLVGNFIPRHWVLLVDTAGEAFGCYEPSSGAVRAVNAEAIRHARLTGVGFPRPFAFVLPA
jgi:hypothetical protein